MGGVLIRAKSPIDGQFAIFRTGTEPLLEFDILSDLFGIYAADRARMMARSRKVNGIPVIDPVYLLKSKLLNLAGLDQACRQDRKHVEIALHVVRAHLRRGIGMSGQGILGARELIKETKIVTELSKSSRCRRGLKIANRTISAAIPWPDFDLYRDPQLKKFVQNTLSKHRDDATSFQ